MNGKGSKPRPISNYKDYLNNYDLAFGRKCLKCKNKFFPKFSDDEFCNICWDSFDWIKKQDLSVHKMCK